MAKRIDIKSILITLVIVGVSAVLGQLIIMIPNIGLGKDSAVYTAIILALLKGVQKFLDGEASVTNTVTTGTNA